MRFLHRVGSIVFCILLFTPLAAGQPAETILKSVEESSDWKPLAPEAVYDQTSLEQIAARNAEVIALYGFTNAVVQDWSGPDGQVEVKLYEMLDSSAAYGLFSLERDVRQSGYATLPLGAEGYRAGNRTRFWQSNYVVELRGDAKAARALGDKISEKILGLSRKAPVVSWLPQKNLIRGSERYLLHPETVGRQTGLDPASLGFEDSVEVATAAYEVDGEAATLILLLYPTQQLARKYVEAWEAEGSPNAAQLKRVSALVALVRETEDESVTKAILDTVGYETQVTWNEAIGGLSFREMMLTIFSFTGIALLFTLVAGLSFGGFRIAVKSLLPNKVFDRPEDVELIQLKLLQHVTRKEIGG